MSHASVLRTYLDARVVGIPRWYAAYQAEGLGRLKWLGAAALVVLPVQAFALALWAPALFAGAAERFGVTPAVLIVASFVPGTSCIALVLMSGGRRAYTTRQAHALAAIAVAGNLATQALLLGFSHVNIHRMATFDLALFSLIALAPLATRACTAMTLMAFTVILLAAFAAGPVLAEHIRYFIHIASYAALGIAVNRWYFAIFRAAWLRDLKRIRRNRQLEAHKRHIEQLLEQLTQANAAKTRFLAAASHDLRQPMHAIGMLVGALGQHIKSPDVQAIVDRLEDSVEATDNLFNELLDISKLDAGAVTVNETTFPIAALLTQIALQYAPEADHKRLGFRVVPSSAIVRSDPTLLYRVLMNLVANAIRYTNRGRIVVGCKRAGSSEIRIIVCDTGCGIPAEQLDAIFGEFVQLDNEARDRNKGLGLGLAIVARTAKLLGHQITIRSHVGRGSIFAVRLPLVGFHRSALRTHATTPTSKDPMMGNFVVVVDEEQDILFSMDALLKKHHCHVLCARGGDEAVARLRDHLRVPDLIITDYRVALDETGTDVISKICQAQGTHVPALILTGADSPADLAAATGSGYPVLLKPATERQLLAKVAEVLGSYCGSDCYPTPHKSVDKHAESVL